MIRSIKEILLAPDLASSQVVHGWIRTKREAKNVVFLELNDGSLFDNLQIVIDTSDNATDISRLTTGASVKVTGSMVSSQGGKQQYEIQAREIELLGSAPADTYPLQKKRHSLEFLREIAHLRPRTNTFGAVTRVRNAAAFAVHRFYQERGFFYVNTPVITASDCEGAGEMFQVTTLPVEELAKKGAVIDYKHDFFGKKASLTVSGQLEAETYATAMSRVYTFGPTFRAENSNTTRHLAEFWMIEPEMAFFELGDNIELAQDFIVYVISAVMNECKDDLSFFNERIQPGLIDQLSKVVTTPFVHITYTEAVETLLKSGKTFEFPVKWGIDMQSEHERFLTDEVFKGPVVVTDYPKEIKSFYMYQNEDGKTVRAMDVLVPRLGEIIGGSQREHRYDRLTERMKDLGLNEADYWWYLDLRRFGTVPHSGFGLGFERLIQYITGMQNIRDVIPFPRSVGTADF